MHNKTTMEMSICQAENGFSLDELVKKLADAFENKAFADILKMNLQLTQEVLIYRLFNCHDNQQCCPDGHLMLNGSFERRIRTSLGEFKMDFWRVRCSKCGKTFAPLAKFIGLECYQIKKTVGSASIQIMPDGTGFKGSGVNDQARKGDLKVVIGISQQGNIFPLASKAGATWKDITDEWDRNKIKFKDGSILICDGYRIAKG